MVDFAKLNTKEGRLEAKSIKGQIERDQELERRGLLSGLIMMNVLAEQNKLQKVELSLLDTLKNSWQHDVLYPTEKQMNWMRIILEKNGKMTNGIIKPIFGWLPHDIDGKFVATSNEDSWVGNAPEDCMLRAFAKRDPEAYMICFRADTGYTVEFASVDVDQFYSGKYSDPKLMMVDPALMNECADVFRDLQQCGMKYPIDSKARQIICDLQGAFLNPSVCALSKGERDRLKSLLSSDAVRLFSPKDYKDVVDTFTRGTSLFRPVSPLIVIRRLENEMGGDKESLQNDDLENDSSMPDMQEEHPAIAALRSLLKGENLVMKDGQRLRYYSAGSVVPLIDGEQGIMEKDTICMMLEQKDGREVATGAGLTMDDFLREFTPREKRSAPEDGFRFDPMG